MKSYFRIDFSDLGPGKGLQPVIVVNVEPSEDPRDKLVKSYFELLGGESSWLKVEILGGSAFKASENPGDKMNTSTSLEIRALAPSDLPGTIAEIAKRYCLKYSTIKEFSDLPIEILVRHPFFDEMKKVSFDQVQLYFTLPESCRNDKGNFKFLDNELSSKNFVFTKMMK